MTIIAQLSDIHIGAEGSASLDQAAGPVRALRAAVTSLLTLPVRPDCLVLTGDLVDNGRPAEYARLLALLSPLGMPIHPLPGNHDDRAALRAAFAGHPGVAGDGNGPFPSDQAPVQYAVELPDIRLICCDTARPGTPYGEMDQARLGWLDATLSARPDLPTVIAMHHPPYPTGLGFVDSLRPADRSAFTAVVARHDQVRRIISGHAHRGSLGTVGRVGAVTCPSTYRQLHLDLRPPGQASWTGEPAGYALHVVGPDGIVTHFCPIGDYRPLMGADQYERP